MIEGLPGFTLVAAFLAGLAGGVHCAAMCGPIVGIACGARGDRAGSGRWLRHALAYNAGRIASYAAAGAITGAIGAGGLALRGELLTQQVMLAVMSVSLIVLAAYVAGIAPLDGCRDPPLQRRLVAPDFLIDRETALVVVVRDQAIRCGHRQPDRDRRGRDGGGRRRHQDPGPGFAVPGLHDHLTMKIDGSRR